MKNKNIGIIILAVICAGLMAAVAFTLIKGKNGTPGKQEASVDSEEETNQSGIVEEDGQKYKRNTDIKTILFMGVDKDEKADLGNNPGENGQSDSLNLLVINKVEKTAQILQISRDSMIDIDIYDVTGNKLMTEDGQIALQYAYGDGEELPAHSRKSIRAFIWCRRGFLSFTDSGWACGCNGCGRWHYSYST